MTKNATPIPGDPLSRTRQPLPSARYPRSVVEMDGTTYFLIRANASEEKQLAILGDARGFESHKAAATRPRAERRTEHQGLPFLFPLTAANAAALRERLPWLKPQTLGLHRTVGCGDRLGLATPGHVRAVRQFDLVPVFAQQSVRENARTGRTPQGVLDDAMWGAFQEGWRHPWGADADHLKTTGDIDSFVAAGYTFYTVDPGAHVDNEAHSASRSVLAGKWEALPWAGLSDSPDAMRARYLGHRFLAEALDLEFEPISLQRAACKYGAAIAHVAQMYRHLAARMGSQPFELEVSVDETETPTSPLEHWFVASELRRMDVRWVSLAPRYIGRFEKGVDYIGDLHAFEAEFAQHAAIARALGPYKLSLHSGSDKFSIYPLAARHTGPLLHLKTAGTSYLEALRALAAVDPALFREILAFARPRYATDRATYHVSADPTRVPGPDDLADAELSTVLDLFDGREVLHVTFGSVLDQFGPCLKGVLARHEETYYAALEAHFAKHLTPFASVSQ
jgi:hypothetical protein